MLPRKIGLHQTLGSKGSFKNSSKIRGQGGKGWVAHVWCKQYLGVLVKILCRLLHGEVHAYKSSSDYKRGIML